MRLSCAIHPNCLPCCPFPEREGGGGLGLPPLPFLPPTLPLVATSLPRSCRFCRASAMAIPANPLEMRDQSGERAKQIQKAAKTAMFTAQVNITGHPGATSTAGLLRCHHIERVLSWPRLYPHDPNASHLAKAATTMSATSTHPFGSLLRRHRQAAGLTQEELAERAGLSVEGISALERGVNRAPRKDTVELLAEALGLAAAARDAFAIAARSSAQPLATPAPTADAASLPPLVGRVAELARLEQHLAGGESPVWLLSGDPGIGKSRLLHEAARRAPALGWSVLEGGCHRRSGQEPYAPILGALERAIARRAPTQRRADLQGCAWLVRLLPELADVVAPPAPSWPLPPEQERRLMFAAVARFLANTAGPAGTLLILDDLQWAGPDALDLLNALMRASAGPPLRVAGAYRDSDIRPGDPLVALLADWAREGLAAQSHLTPLDDAASAQLLDGLLAGHATAPASDTMSTREHVARLAGGVPFYLVSYAQALRSGLTPAADAAHDAAQAVPWNVAQTIRQRLAVLRDDTRVLVSVVAVMGRHTPLNLLLAAAEQPEPAALAALDEASRA